MRLLFLSNFYPPADRGGWEQWCQEIADAFIARGHAVRVLTSRYLAAQTPIQPHVQRLLHLENDLEHYRPADFFLSLAAHDRYNARTLAAAVREFSPHAILIWGMWQLNPQLAVLAEDLCPGRVGYYMCGYWPIEPDIHTQFWQTPEKKTWVQTMKWLGAPLAHRILMNDRSRSPQFLHVASVSRAVLDIFASKGLDLPDANVIYGGIKLNQFSAPISSLAMEGLESQARLVFAGSVSPEKGVQTAIQAVALLAHRFNSDRLHLTIIGAGHPDFEKEMHDLVQKSAIKHYVSFMGRVPKDDMAQVLHKFNVLLFPSIWPEPLARMTMEAMASGMALISTTTGGTREILTHGENALTYSAGDGNDLSRQIVRLMEEPGLADRLGANALRTAHERLDFGRMVDELEAFAENIVEEKTP